VSEYKSIPHQEFKALFEDAGLTVTTPPLQHQYASLAFIVDGRDRAFLAHDIGTGKSYTALLATLWWQPARTLIVCPNSVLPSWAEQIHEHLGQSFDVLTGSSERRRQIIECSFNRLFVCNWEGLPGVFGKWSVDANGKKTRVVDQDMVLRAGFDCVVFDEIHHAKTPGAVWVDLAAALSRVASYCIAMTGTPVARDELDLWAQYWILDHGQTLGDNFYRFRSKFFNSKVKRVRRGRRVAEYTIKPGASELILDMIAPVTLRYSREECADLPERVFERRVAAQTKEQQAALKRIKDGIDIAELNLNNIINSNITQKLSQIAGGFVYDDDGHTHRIPNHKGDELVDVIQSIPGKVIVYHEYQAEGAIIEELCRKQGWRFASMRAEVADKMASHNMFKQDPNCRVLIAHPASGGEGLNFQGVCDTIIFYSHGYSLIQRDQCEGRIWRQGQQNPCLFIDLITENSIDDIKLATIRKRADMAAAILKYIQEL
jgi:SNF2 family DNA or RNA helicase